MSRKGSTPTRTRTIYAQVAERCTRRTLDLNIVRLEEEEDRLERVAGNLADVLREASCGRSSASMVAKRVRSVPAALDT